MQISNTPSLGRPAEYLPSTPTKPDGSDSRDSNSADLKKPAVTVDIAFPGEPSTKTNRHKELIAEMFPGPKILGEFENMKGVEQAKDLAIGPDIRYALTSNNPKFIKKLMTGLVTIAEYRELAYRYRELKARNSDDTNILEGELIKKEGLRVVQGNNRQVEKGSIFGLKV